VSLFVFCVLVCAASMWACVGGWVQGQIRESMLCASIYSQIYVSMLDMY